MCFWWAGVDSNRRSQRRQIYSLIHLATLEPAHVFLSVGVVELVIGLEPTTPCNNPPASATLRTGAQLCPLRGLRGAGVAVSRPSGCYLSSIGSRCPSSIEKSKTEKATRWGACDRAGSPQAACLQSETV